MAPTTKISSVMTPDAPNNPLEKRMETYARPTSESPDVPTAIYACPRRPLWTGPRLTSQIGANLLFHWLKVMPDLIYPHPEGFYDNIGSQYMSMLCDAQSSLLAPTLAQAAVHLAAIGTITKPEALERKQRALEAVLLAVWESTSRSFPAEDAVFGSMALVTLQVGHGAQAVRTVLRGMRAQLELRWKFHGGLSPRRLGRHDWANIQRGACDECQDDGIL